MITSLLDDMLDRTVVAGHTNVGYRIRSRGWSATELQRMQGKVVLVTGASSGLGLAAAEGFARLGATVWPVVRSLERGEQARVRIVERSGSGDVHVGVCNLSELESVRQFAGRFRGQASRLDVLVNNAGVMTEARGVSADGIEPTLATNVVGPFLLTNLLIPLLQDSAPARIINVSSGGMYTQKLRVDDLQSERGQFDGPKVYVRTKRAEVILTEIWAEQLAGTGVVVHSMHPGWADTPGVRSSLPRFYKLTRPLLRTPAQGADTVVWLSAAAEPGGGTGRFWHDRRPRPTHWLRRIRETRQERTRLLAECVRLSGWHDASVPATST
jgi:dehydrogenase/reductase SDR family member 12